MLPEHLGAALVARQHARQHEQEIRQPVEMLERLWSNVLRARQRPAAALGASADRASQGGVGGGSGLINSQVAWEDLRGNVTSRQDLKLSPAVTEDFLSAGVPGNDPLNRFDRSNRNGSQNLRLWLDPNGNITSKKVKAQTPVDYVYTGIQPGCEYYAHTQPRAVRKIGSTVYCYDENGNMEKRGGSIIEYASFNLPTVINSGGNSSTLYYGAFRNRYKQVSVSSGAIETTTYVAGIFEKVIRPNSVVEYRHYLPGGTGFAAIHTRRTSGGNSTYYWHADHLGSPELFTDSAGTALVRPSFGAYGERRDGTDWDGLPSSGDMTKIGNITRRGFTGHEHLDSVGLIHMNGRVYDPTAGRFMSFDPLLRVGVSQDVNRYSYAWNNPLNVIDPSGLDDDPIVHQCIGADYCPGTSPAAPISDEVIVRGSRVPDGWGSVSGVDLANQMASWGSGIDLAIQLSDGGVERQFTGPDGEIMVSASRIGATFSASVFGATGEQSDEIDTSRCDRELIDRGTRFVDYARSAAKGSLYITGAGTSILLAGAASGNPALMGIGGGVVRAGGYLGIMAGGLQIAGGIMQGYGGASYQNAWNGIAGIAAGLTVGGFLGPLTVSPNASVVFGAAMTGLGADVAVMSIEDMAPPVSTLCH